MNLRKYLAFVKLIFIRLSKYKYEIIWNFLSSVILIIFLILFWKSVYVSGGTINGYDFNDILKYTLLSQIIYALTTNRIDRVISKQIQDGSILNSLTTPVNLFFKFWFIRIGEVVWVFLTQIILFILTIFIYFDVSVKKVEHLVFFVILIFISIYLNFVINYIVGLFSCWIISVEGVTHFKDFLFSICSGLLIPLEFFEDKYRNIIEFLPFKYIIYMPINSLKVNSIENFYSILYGIIWCLVLSYILFKFQNRALEKLSIFEG